MQTLRCGPGSVDLCQRSVFSYASTYGARNDHRGRDRVNVTAGSIVVPTAVSGLPERLDGKILDSFLATSGLFWWPGVSPKIPGTPTPLIGSAYLSSWKQPAPHNEPTRRGSHRSSLQPRPGQLLPS